MATNFDLKDFGSLEEFTSNPPSLADDIACEVMALPWVKSLVKDNTDEEIDAMCNRHGDIQNLVASILEKHKVDNPIV